MDKRFQKNYPLRASDFDCRSKLQPASILDLFQDVAGLHALSLGIGHDEMLEQELIWVVVKVKFQTLRDAEMYQDVIVETWPLPQKRIGFQREYLIKDQNDETIVKGSSEWVLMHSKDRRIVRVSDVYPFDDGFCTEQVFGGRLSKIHDVDTAGEGHVITPGFSDLDLNGHVNNTKYANFVLNAVELKPHETIDTFQMDYHREVTSGTDVTILTKHEEKSIFAKGINPEGAKMFTCRIELK